MGHQHRLLSPDEAAARAGLTVEELNELLTDPAGPPYIRLTPRITRYVDRDIDEWAADNNQQ